MSNVDQEELITTSSDGVTVEKSFEPDDFPVPAIAFVIQSDRDETVSIRLVDHVPDDVPPEDIGFHPNYGAEFWEVEGKTIVFTRDLDPGEEYTTVYGLRGGDADDAERFMTTPELDSVDPPLPEDSGEAVREVIEDGVEEDDADSADGTDGPDADTAPGDDVESAVNQVDTDTDADAEPTADEPDTSVDLDEPVDDSTEATAGTVGEPTGSTAVAVEGSLAAELAAEIRDGEVDDDDLEVLRDALGVGEPDGSVEARIEHLQSEMADVEAYAEAIEEFLDENGTAQQMLDDLQGELDATKERIDGIEATAEEAVETAQSAESAVEAIQEGVHDETDERLEDLESELDALSEELDDLADELDDVAELRTRLASAIGGLDVSDDDESDGDGTEDNEAGE